MSSTELAAVGLALHLGEGSASCWARCLVMAPPVCELLIHGASLEAGATVTHILHTRKLGWDSIAGGLGEGFTPRKQTSKP